MSTGNPWIIGAGIVGSIFGFASGGIMPRAGLALVGEEGPELLRLPSGSQIIPNGQFSAGAQNNIRFSVHIANVNGIDQVEQIGERLARGIERRLALVMQ
jgi:hypothetical protein